MEVKARGGKIIVIGTEGVEIPEKAYDDIVKIPPVHPAILPIVSVLPLQLFAYYTALERHCNVDKPRNLAKSVTVEWKSNQVESRSVQQGKQCDSLRVHVVVFAPIL